MNLSWNRRNTFLLAGDRQIPCWCKVRNELNGLRPKANGDAADLFCASPPGQAQASGPPSMPRVFPVGSWRIICINPHPDPKWDNGYLYPFWIGTDAEQELDVWSLNDGGRYDAPTGEKVLDTGYGLHFSSCDWTQGCIRSATEADLRWIVANVRIGDPFVVTEEAA